MVQAIWGVGLNYHSKAELTGRPLPAEPILFLVPPSSLGGPDGAVRLPLDRTAQPDYEGEIAVVLGRSLYRATPEQARTAVRGITAANDLTARDVMKSTGSPLLAKSFPGFTQLGPDLRVLEDPDELEDVRLRTLVNGEPRQDDQASGLIFAVPELLSRISYHAQLDPGDVVLTGTPAGTGQDLGVYLRPGDVVTVEVDGLRPLVTQFV